MRVCSVSCVLFLFYYPHILYGFLEKWKWKKLCEPFSWSPMWNYQGWLSEKRSESFYFTVEKMTVRIRTGFTVYPLFSCKNFGYVYGGIFPQCIVCTSRFTTVIKGITKRYIPRLNLALHLTPYLKNCDQKIFHGKFLYLSIRFEMQRPQIWWRLSFGDNWYSMAAFPDLGML